ncbi:MAG: DUF2490 domain-containing protein [Acidobacteriota bacterium]
MALRTRAQTVRQDDEDFQSWNDVELTVAITNRVDFVTKGTIRFAQNALRFDDGRYQFGFDWKAFKGFSVSPFYMYKRATNNSGFFRTEHRLDLLVSYRFPIKSFDLIHRSSFERRIRQPVSSWRYRAYLEIEKDKEIPKRILPKATFFIRDQVLYDSSVGKLSRNRFSVGIKKTLTKQVSVDIHYMHQNEADSHPGVINTIWTSWKVKL